MFQKAVFYKSWIEVFRLAFVHFVKNNSFVHRIARDLYLSLALELKR